MRVGDHAAHDIILVVNEVRIAVVGDYAGTVNHRATTDAVAHAGAPTGIATSATWIATPDLEDATVAALSSFDGVWIAPGSPYRGMQGALAAIRTARTGQLPLIATCAGFQHVVIEYARNVLGVGDAQHAEYDPNATRLFITALECSLAGMTMAVQLRADTTAAIAYGATEATESYYCNFGLNPDCLADLQDGGLVVSGVDQDGEVRVVELPTHPFYVATLFVPQAASRAHAPHPLVSAFVSAAVAARRPR